jgi:hypothetical protein
MPRLSCLFWPGHSDESWKVLGLTFGPAGDQASGLATVAASKSACQEASRLVLCVILQTFIGYI